MSEPDLEIDLVGSLRQILTDLQGYSALANELIQNADDASGDREHGAATQMAFDVSEKGLTVWNDGAFLYCGQYLKECGHDEPCDFHAFLRVASGSKRHRGETTGAFGIGFTTVYQITDRPQVITPEIHITLQPEAERRVVLCSGCQRCKDATGTTMFLPWAVPGSKLRQELQQDARHEPGPMLDELRSCLRLSLPFLRRVHRIELRDEGQPDSVFRREDTDTGVRLVGPGDEWMDLHSLSGTFADAAAELRSDPYSSIEDTREDDVYVLVGSQLTEGRLFAVLPTEQHIAPAMFICADFFPHSDRRSVDLSRSTTKGDWNRAALRAAGGILADQIGDLPGMIGPDATWRLISAVFAMSNDKDEDESLRGFWDLVAESAAQANIAPVVDGSLDTPDGCLFVPAEDDDVANDLLTRMGAAVLDPAIRPYLHSLERSRLGITQLDAGVLAELLNSLNTEEVLDGAEAQQELWGLMERILDRAALRRDSAQEHFRATATAPVGQRALRTWDEVMREPDGAARDVFAAYCPLVNEERLGLHTDLAAELAPVLRVQDVARLFRDPGADGTPDEIATVRYLYARRQAFKDDATTKAGLRSLPIFPRRHDTEQVFDALEDLALPIDKQQTPFDDAAGIARVLDASDHEVRQLAELLAIEHLTLNRYLLEDLPDALPDQGVPDWIDDLIQMLVVHQTEILGDPDTREGLRNIAFVPCGDGLVPPGDTLLPTDAVTTVLGADWPTYTGPPEARHLLEELGASDTPRPSDVIARIKEIVQAPPTPDAINAIEHVVRILGPKAHEPDFADEYSELKAINWLPAKGDQERWYAANEVYREDRSYLFASQATFVDLRRRVQREASMLLDSFGCESEPTADLVVAHLKHLHDQAAPSVPNTADIYTKLNSDLENVDLDELGSFPCLYLGDGRWVLPGDAFWQDPALGPFATRLDPAIWSRWRALLDALGTRERPGPVDAARVLADVAERDGLAWTEREQIAARAWEILDEALADRAIEPTWIRHHVSAHACVPVDGEGFRAPSHVWVDDRPQLSDRLRAHLGAALITRPAGAWAAMQAAGVHTLSEDLRARPRCDAQRPHRIITRLVGERQQVILRLLENAVGSQRAAKCLERLDEIEFKAAPNLSVEWTFTSYYGVRVTVEDPGAVWVRTDDAILIDGDLDDAESEQRRSNSGIWLDIAREIAFALDVDPSHLTALRDVLREDDNDEAHSLLDRLSIPRIAEAAGRLVTEASGSGADSDDAEPKEPSEQEPDVAPVDEVDDNTSDAASEAPASETEEPSGESHEPQEPDNAPPAPDEPRPSGERRAPGPGTGGQSPSGRSRESRPRERRSTYEAWHLIVSGRAAGRGAYDEERAARLNNRRSEIDQAGVDAVCTHEIEAGRVPTVMDHFNEGFDIESRDHDGELLRHIEVKSLAGEWDPGFPAVSPAQMRFAADHPETFWLYVVELADSNPRITRIHNPLDHVTKYSFDRGWASLNEADDDSGVESLEELLGEDDSDAA